MHRKTDEVKALITEQKEKIERFEKLNREMEEELEDINEIVEEKIIGKTIKKRESSDRLEQATKIYHDELFLSESYLQTFLSMRSFFLQYPFEQSQLSIENFKIDLVY